MEAYEVEKFAKEQLRREKLGNVQRYTDIKREQAAPHESDIAAKQQTIDQLQEDIGDLQDDVTEKQGSIDDLGSSMGVLQNEINVHNQTILEKQGIINDQQAAAKSARSQCDFVVEMMIQSRLTTINIHKALLRK